MECKNETFLACLWKPVESLERPSFILWHEKQMLLNVQGNAEKVGICFNFKENRLIQANSLA